MKRRDFLWTSGRRDAPPRLGRRKRAAQPCSTTAAQSLSTRIDPASGALWIRKADLPRINGFELKPQGACRADICIPIPRT